MRRPRRVAGRSARAERELFVSPRAARIRARGCADLAPAPRECLAQQPLDLAVHTAQLLDRHRLDRGGNRRIEAQQERFPLWRLAQDAAALLIQRAGVDHGLSFALRAQHD
jgi:hypothetical protein